MCCQQRTAYNGMPRDQPSAVAPTGSNCRLIRPPPRGYTPFRLRLPVHPIHIIPHERAAPSSGHPLPTGKAGPTLFKINYNRTRVQDHPVFQAPSGLGSGALSPKSPRIHLGWSKISGARTSGLRNECMPRPNWPGAWASPVTR